jgi:hypothetical protein
MGGDWKEGKAIFIHGRCKRVKIMNLFPNWLMGIFKAMLD